MAATIKALENTMYDYGFTCWKVKSRGGNLLGYFQDKKTDIDASFTRLKKLLSELTDDIVRVELTEKPASEKEAGGTLNTIKMEVDLTTLRAPGVGAVSSGNSEQITRLMALVEKGQAETKALEKKLTEAIFENQIKSLRQEIAGLKDSNPMDKLIEAITPALSQWLPSTIVTAPPAALAGVEPVTALEKIEKVLGRPSLDYLLNQLATNLETDAAGTVEKIKKAFDDGE